MKKFIKLYIVIIILSLVVQGCRNTDIDDVSKVHKMFSELKTYTSTAEIIVKDNKISENYVVKQYFKYPDLFRLEVISPDDKKGKITIYDGEMIWIHHPQIKQSYAMEGNKKVEEADMFPGYFAKNLFTGEEAEYQIKRDGHDEYIVIKVDIPNGNSYRKSQVLYLDRKTAIPRKMEVLDSKNQIAVIVYYKDFLYNTDIDERLFTKESVPALSKIIFEK